MGSVDLTGKVALVTGGGVGIGRAIALALVNAGADIAVTYRSHDAKEVAKVAGSLGRRCFASALDVTDSHAVDRVVGDASAALGALDIVVANAGGLLGRVPLAKMSDEQWHEVLDTNLSSAFYLVRSALQRMNDGGRIILISSMAAFSGGSDGAGAYAAAKAGMIGLSGALAKEVADRQITVNAVAPGMILDTPFHETFTPRARQEEVAARLPVRRAGVPSDVAELVAYLASGNAGFMTGQTIKINGGEDLI